MKKKYYVYKSFSLTRKSRVEAKAKVELTVDMTPNVPNSKFGILDKNRIYLLQTTSYELAGSDLFVTDVFDKQHDIYQILKSTVHVDFDCTLRYFYFFRDWVHVTNQWRTLCRPPKRNIEVDVTLIYLYYHRYHSSHDSN